MSFQELRHQTQQHLSVTPRLAQSVRLLQMSSLDYVQELRSAAADNPFLEVEDEEPEHEPALPLDPEAPSAAEAAEGPDEYDSWVDVERDRSLPETGTGSSFDQRAAETSLAACLHAQLGLLQLPERDAALAHALVESLDDDGYLRVELEELATLLPLEPEADADEWRIALCRVQSLEPCGVGARTLNECLALQLRAIDCDAQERRLAIEMASGPLDRLINGSRAALAQSFGCTEAAAAAALARIRTLDPRPGWRFGAADIRYVVPDVMVRRARGRWVAALNDAIVPKLRLHCVYAEILGRQQRGRHPELSDQLREARWTLRNVEQRFATILGVAEAIVERQQAFFSHGPLALKPLGLSEIAQAVGVHESTVSRATSGKYMATPFGRLEFKYFFSRRMLAASGAELTGASIRAEVERMIAAERAGRPLSDVEIQCALARQGIEVTRRTVTKYRTQLRIGSVKERRRTVPAAACGALTTA